MRWCQGQKFFEHLTVTAGSYGCGSATRRPHMSIGERQIVRTIPGVDGDPQAWAEPWQQSWDLQQQGFLFDREQRFAALLDLVEAAVGPAPTVVDLACGTASITRRLLARLPEAR